MIKTLFFDVFGTLVDWRTSLINNIKKRKIINEKNTFLEQFVINWRLEYQPILNKVNKRKLSWMLLDDLHLISLNKALKKMDINYLSEIKKIELVSYWHNLNPWKDVKKGLISLNKNFMTATLSNGNLLLQRNLVKNANLELNFLFSAENFKKYKPDLSVYLGAAETLKIKPSECALVASHKNDLKAASSAGFFTIFIKREKEYGNYCYKFPNTNFSADVEIDSLEKLSKELR